MNKKESIQKIISDIQDIYSVVNRFENTENIHPLDIDLALSKVRNLYELLLKLDSSKTYSSENQREEISTEYKQDLKSDNKQSNKDIKPSQQKEEIKTESEPSEEIKINSEDKEEEETIKEPEFVIETPSQKEEKEIIEKVQEKDVKQNGNSPEIVADKFQSKKFIHDNIAQKNTKQDVSSKLQSKPIKDINTAIGINDKFIFIRELFDNDKEHYHETIQILNNFDTYENAVEFLDENFDWNPEDSNYERLKELVRRKYSAK